MEFESLAHLSRWRRLVLAGLIAAFSLPAIGSERLVSGVVYSCMLDGIRTYTSKPIANCGGRREINYSYFERILKPGERAIYSCIDYQGVQSYRDKAGPGCQYVASHFDTPQPQPRRRSNPPAASFGNYSCTSDCSGHRAGYEWARNRGISDAYQCTGNSQSFIEGCSAFTEGHPGF